MNLLSSLKNANECEERLHNKVIQMEKKRKEMETLLEEWKNKGIDFENKLYSARDEIEKMKKESLKRNEIQVAEMQEILRQL